MLAWFVLWLPTQAVLATDETEPLVVRVLALNFDPVVAAEKKRLHAVCDWFNPKSLAEGYIDDVTKASGGFIQYELVMWKELDAFPVKQDGFRYSIESYLACRDGKAKWHAPDQADYPKLLKDYGAIDLINAGRVDEVWIFGGPYFGFHESGMVGPKAFYINGGVYDRVAVKRTFAVMGFNYERGGCRDVAQPVSSHGINDDAGLWRLESGAIDHELGSVCGERETIRRGGGRQLPLSAQCRFGLRLCKRTQGAINGRRLALLPQAHRSQVRGESRYVGRAGLPPELHEVVVFSLATRRRRQRNRRQAKQLVALCLRLGTVGGQWITIGKCPSNRVLGAGLRADSRETPSWVDWHSGASAGVIERRRRAPDGL